MKKFLSSAPTYKQYIESLSDYTLKSMREERKNKLIEPHKIRDRGEVEKQLDIINEVLKKRK